MRIAQIVLPGASHYEQKSQRLDRAALAERHELADEVALRAVDSDRVRHALS